jgi:hypothetical protein
MTSRVTSAWRTARLLSDPVEAFGVDLRGRDAERDQRVF